MRMPSTSGTAAVVTRARRILNRHGQFFAHGEAMRWRRRRIRDVSCWDPDPKSRTGAVRIIGNSASAGFVITIIATGGARAGVTAWKSSGADLRDYEGQG